MKRQAGMTAGGVGGAVLGGRDAGGVCLKERVCSAASWAES